MSGPKFQEILGIIAPHNYFATNRELDLLFETHELDKYDDLDPNFVAKELGSRRNQERLTVILQNGLILSSLNFFNLIRVKIL